MISRELAQTSDRPVVLSILAPDEFGQAVGEALQELVPWAVQMTLSIEQFLKTPDLPGAQAYLLVAGYPASRLCHILNDLSYTHQVPFLPAIISSPYLEIGPLVIPGSGACYACYECRFLQHTALPQVHKRRHQYYDTHPIPDPVGYLPPLAFLTATRLVQLLVQGLERPGHAGGYYWRWNIVHAEAHQSHVIGMHGCMYCGLKRDEKGRSFQAMQGYLRRILPWGSASTSVLASLPVPALEVPSLSTGPGGDC